MKARGSSPGGGERRSGWGWAGAVLAVGVLGLTACDGDTLYSEGPPDAVPPPTVEFLAPIDGLQVTAGRPIPVLVTAQDTLGVASLEISYRGVATGTILYEFVPPRATVTADTVVVVPAVVSGSLELRATATNGRGGVGRSEVVVVPVMLSDTIAPAVALTVQAAERLELTDSIRARISAIDNPGGSGLTRVGLTVLMTRPGVLDTLVFERVFELGQPQAGAVVRDVVFAPPFVTERELPAQLSMSFHAFAVDSAGNCAAGVAATAQRLPCQSFRNSTIGAGVAAAIPTLVVAGRSVALPQDSEIRDASPDVARQRLYLSNLTRSRIEVLDLANMQFGTPVAVGSQPWGVHVNRTGDSLIVANSGGTSLSYVRLTGAPAEVVSQRVHTPNVNLFEIKFHRDGNGVERLAVVFLDFSDRPQHVAQDAFGRLLYSTLPTAAAGAGTMRVADKQPGWQQPEVRILLGRNVIEPDSFTISVVNVDSMRVTTTTQGDFIEIFDHVAGFPGQIISSGLKSMSAALDSLRVNPQSDIRFVAGRWDRTLVGLSELTFVSASGNRNRVAFGEGARGNGRVFMWEAPLAEISNEITVADLVGNTAEQILGIDLNQDGTLNTARGRAAAFYFKEDLRLQGHFGAVAAGVGSGAGLHPTHPSYTGYPPSGPATLSYVAAGSSIKIVDTVHFNERGEIQIRDNIVGPMKVSGPLPGDNAACSGADCVVARVYGVTDGGAVVVVPVRGRDIR